MGLGKGVPGGRGLDRGCTVGLTHESQWESPLSWWEEDVGPGLLAGWGGQLE